MKEGAVLDVNAGQLAVLREDDAVDHLSGDIRIKSSVDAAAIEAIGVDQVWAGSGDVPARCPAPRIASPSSTVRYLERLNPSARAHPDAFLASSSRNFTRSSRTLPSGFARSTAALGPGCESSAPLLLVVGPSKAAIALRASTDGDTPARYAASYRPAFSGPRSTLNWLARALTSQNVMQCRRRSLSCLRAIRFSIS